MFHSTPWHQFQQNFGFAFLEIVEGPNTTIISNTVDVKRKQQSPSSEGGATSEEGVEEDAQRPQVALGTIILCQPIEHINHLC